MSYHDWAFLDVSSLPWASKQMSSKMLVFCRSKASWMSWRSWKQPSPRNPTPPSRPKPPTSATPSNRRWWPCVRRWIRQKASWKRPSILTPPMNRWSTRTTFEDDFVTCCHISLHCFELMILMYILRLALEDGFFPSCEDRPIGVSISGICLPILPLLSVERCRKCPWKSPLECRPHFVSGADDGGVTAKDLHEFRIWWLGRQILSLSRFQNT